MKYLFIVYSFLFCVFVQAQNEAYYIGVMGDADLFRVKIEQGNMTLQEAYSFKDSVVPANRIHVDFYEAPFRRFPLAMDTVSVNNPVFADSIPPLSPFIGAHSYGFKDSVQVAGKWYRIFGRFSDDGFVGGSPNQVDHRVTVSELGMIYSSSNYMGQHQVMMLSHNDEHLQQVLLKVYELLDQKNRWHYWDKCKELSSAYPFSTALPELKKYWLSNLSDLQLIDAHASVDGMTVHYTATIRNRTQTGYFIPSYTYIGPAKATIIYENGLINHWDLLQTSYGEHFTHLKDYSWLAPGDTLKFTHNFQLNSGWINSKVTYEGFQLFSLSHAGLLNWLVGDPIVEKGKSYRIFPHREVKF